LARGQQNDWQLGQNGIENGQFGLKIAKIFVSGQLFADFMKNLKMKVGQNG